jgi:hypothetical protein
LKPSPACKVISPGVPDDLAPIAAAVLVMESVGDGGSEQAHQSGALLWVGCGDEGQAVGGVLEGARQVAMVKRRQRVASN